MVDASRAAAVVNPPNPNAALNQFVGPAGDGTGPVFDAASWANVAQSDASWASASWANASWASASWANASWASASWANASWASASWASASWASRLLGERLLGLRLLGDRPPGPTTPTASCGDEGEFLDEIELLELGLGG